MKISSAECRIYKNNFGVIPLNKGLKYRRGCPCVFAQILFILTSYFLNKFIINKIKSITY
jgi:hypothetical protein